LGTNHGDHTHFGLPRNLQSDNGSAIKAEVTHELLQALGIDYYLHCAWHPQSSIKVEKINELLKHHLNKLIQEITPPELNCSPSHSLGLETLQENRA
jgi:hypothetical protein